jgi:hypothetical protein
MVRGAAAGKGGAVKGILQMSDYHRMEAQTVENKRNPRLANPPPSLSLVQALKIIAEFPISDQDNMISANMRVIARTALNGIERQ